MSITREVIDLAEGDIVFTREPHSYSVRGKPVPSVTQVIEEAGMGEDFCMVSPPVLRAAQQRGERVHQACALLADGELDWDSVDPRIRGYVEACASFLSDTKAKIIQTETRMAALINVRGLQVWLAGTPDLVTWLGTERSLVDYKTGQTSSAALQTAGYKTLWERTYPTKLIHRRHSLKLNINGTYRLRPEDDPDDEPAMMDALLYAEAKRLNEPWKAKYGI